MINNARAAIIDEKSMREAIYCGKVAGAALDVFHQEPIKVDDPFMKMDNTVLTPHIAGAGLEVVYRHSNMLVDDLFALLKGEMPKAIINPEAIGDSNRFKEMGKQISPAAAQVSTCKFCAGGSNADSSRELIDKITEEVLKQIKLK